MRKSKWLLWPLLTVAAFIIARILFHQFDGFGGRSLGHGGGHALREMGGHGHIHGGIFSFFVQAGLFVIGWVMWKLAAGNRTRKWIGIAIMVWSALLLFPKALFLPIVLLTAYLAYKVKKKQTKPVAYHTADAAHFTSYQADYLDKWEQNIQKEQ